MNPANLYPVVESLLVIIGHWAIVGGICAVVVLLKVRSDINEAAKSDFGEQDQ